MQIGMFSYLSNILVPDPAYLLDVRGALGDVFQRISGQLQLVFLIFGGLDVDTWQHSDPSYDLFADEVPVQVADQTPIIAKPPNACMSSTYRMSTSYRSVSEFFSMLTLMGK